ncbi:serine/threonine-protein kinase dclk1-like [Plakobranchus ocellatus]|uniref:non-specific serine/threonine protein kinase n=1 Tax=Plakobranchus ocellatus TaxID=259542 RepID=A0AAV3YEK6_9GAST|nr:serine/threonine-protein kinase dclk1-like [Plakobranchus ocellatus]
MPAMNSPRKTFSISETENAPWVAQQMTAEPQIAFAKLSTRDKPLPGNLERLERSSVSIANSLVLDLENLHLSRPQTPPLSSANNSSNNNNSESNNNFLLQFALRRQSHVSLNRLFGGMGETPNVGGRAGAPDASGGSGGKGRPRLPSSSKAQSKESTSCSGAVECSSDTDRCQSSSVRSGYSLSKMAGEKRARKVRFYRNGDRFFKGMVYAVSTERFRTFESLLSALTASAVCDSKVMPNGVRHIFSADGTRHVDSLDQLEEGESYVCASTDVFRSLDYCKNVDPAWNHHLFPFHTANSAQRSQSHSAHLENRKEVQPLDTSSTALSRPFSGGNSAQNNISYRGMSSARDGHATGRSPRGPNLDDMSPEERRAYEEYQRSFVVPCLITVIRSGKRPRKAVRLLLNKKTAISFDQVMADITDAVKLDCGGIKKLFTLSGRQVTCLADFFQGDTVFIASGNKKVTAYDFDLDEDERITLRNSPASSTSKQSDDHPKSTSSGKSDRSVAAKQKKERGGVLEAKDQSIKNEDGSHISLPLVVSNKYQIGTVIGTGNFAVVMECRDKRTKRKYALKIINKDNCKGKEKMIDNEVRILRCVKHPNIVRLFEDFASQHHIFYVMELVKGGDLFDAIANTSSKYTEQDASGMLYNLASALEYLHSLHIVHRDVKPENILIRQHDDGTKSLKLGDFGLATEVNGPQYIVCGTPTYVAPEIIAETGYGLEIDVWSAGVIAYILLCGFPPFSSPTENQDELFDMIMKGNFKFPSPYWDDISASAKDVISRMLDIDADKRLTATQVLEHKWVANDTQYENDLRKNVSIGLSTYFRRGPKSPRRHAGMRVLTTTALDKSSKFFQGRGCPSDRSRGQDTD